MEEFKNVSIAEACKRWPHSKSHAFQFNNHETDYFFRLEEPEFKNNGAKIRTHIQCLKFTRNGNALHITHLAIKNDSIITPIKNLDFAYHVNAGLTKLLEMGGNCPPEMLIPYEAHGFYERQKPFTVV